jgi:hypothetical protein
LADKSHTMSTPGPDREPPRYPLAWMTHDYRHQRTRGRVRLLAPASPANTTTLGNGMPGAGSPSTMTASTQIAAIAGIERAARDQALDAVPDQTR